MRKFCTVALAAMLMLALLSCGQKNSLSTLSVEGDSEVEEVFSLIRALDLGTGYLRTLDYQSAILQYTEILSHDPGNKDAYAGLYAAYAALGQTENAGQVLQDAQQAFGSEEDILGLTLENAGIIYAGGGGNAPFQSLAEHYLDGVLDETNSLYQVGNAWLEAEPGNVGPYAMLGIYYAQQNDTEQLDSLAALAEENGLDLNEIDTEIQLKSNGDYTIQLQIEGLHSEPVEVEIQAGDNAQDVAAKVTQEVAAGAASQVVDQSGLTGDAADLANQYAQEAIRQGLSALPGGAGGLGF